MQKGEKMRREKINKHIKQFETNKEFVVTAITTSTEGILL